MRQGITPWIGTAFGLAMLAVCALASASSMGHASERPNIVLILTDDQTIESFDAKFMPKLHRLVASRGMEFTRYYNTYPMCCPSRTSILRGQYAHNTGVINNGPPDGGYFRFLENGLQRDHLGRWLLEAGYRTGLFGKFLNGYGVVDNRVIGGWHTWFASNTENQPYYNFRINANGENLHFGTGDRNYFTHVVEQRSLKFIRDASRDNQPFFAMIAPFSPHSPSIPADRHKDKFAAEPFPLKPNFNEAAVADKPSYIRTLPKLSAATIDKIAANWRRRLEANLSVDDLLGSLFNTLQELGESQNTFVFVTTDNGFERGEHRLVEGKSVPYDESVRSKLFVFGPGVRKGIRSDALVANIDLAPTFAELASAVVPDYVDGRSLVPLFSQDAAWRKSLFTMGYPPVSTLGEPKELVSEAFRSLVTRRYVYTLYAETHEREMYDLRSDPYELVNIASEMSAPFKSAAEALLEKLHRCSGAECREVDSSLPPAFPD